MDLHDALELGNAHLNSHGLNSKGWTFGFDNASRRLGLCSYDNKRITVSRKMASAGTRDEVEQIIIHEVAHALVGSRTGHGPAWKAKAAELGYRGGRLSTNPHTEKLKAARAIDAPLEVGAIATDGHSDAQIIHFARGNAYGLVLTGRRRGKVIYNNPESFTVVKAATPAEADAAAQLWADHVAGRTRQQGRAAAQPRMTPPLPRAQSVLSGKPLPGIVPGATVTTARNTGVVDRLGTRFVYYKTADGTTWKADALAILSVTPPTAATLPQRPVRLSKGTNVSILDRGKYYGVRGVITKVNPTRYVVALDNGTALTVPHELAERV